MATHQTVQKYKETREESWQDREMDQHPGQIKHGEHWYDPDDIAVSPIDRFAEEFDKAVDEGRWFEEEADWLWTVGVVDFWEIVSFAIGGFYDDGMSYDKALVLLKRDGWTDFMSYETQQYLLRVRSSCVVRKDAANCWKYTWLWFAKRVAYFWTNLQPIAWGKFAIEFWLVGLYQGKWGRGVTPMSPMIFGSWNAIVYASLLIFKIVFNAWINKWWAEGNLILIGDEIFSWVSFIFFILDAYNFEMYQYTLRPLRYISYFISMIYVVTYFVMMISAVEEVFVRDEMEETDKQSLPDFMKGVTLSYLSFNFFPTFWINLGIVIKEMTMDQLAWTAQEDFVPGEVEGLGWNTDLLEWLGISEDYDSYLETFKTQFAQVYF